MNRQIWINLNNLKLTFPRCKHQSAKSETRKFQKTKHKRRKQSIFSAQQLSQTKTTSQTSTVNSSWSSGPCDGYSTLSTLLKTTTTRTSPVGSTSYAYTSAFTSAEKLGETF